MDTHLAGKTALITGGSSGIGFGISKMLAREGVYLAVASRAPDPEAIKTLNAICGKCISICADISKEKQVVAMVKEAIDALGKIDIFINNAAWTWHEPITRITSEALRKTIDTNLAACIYACREVSKHMISAAGGNIVIIGSTSRIIPSSGEIAYRISKAGLTALMQNLAVELSCHGIRINMITPGHFQTRMTASVPKNIENRLLEIIPFSRFGDPEEIGNAVVFLASDQLSGYTTGADLVIDGGLTLNPLPIRTYKEIKELNL